MRTLESPLARRLMLALMLLTLVPIVAFVLFVQRSVSDALVAIASSDVQTQARLLAASLPPDLEPERTSMLLERAGGETLQTSVIASDGRYLAHPEPGRLGLSARDDYLNETVDGFFASPAGVIHELASGRLIGYAALPGQQAAAIVASERDVVDEPLRLIRLAGLAQMALSLLVVAVVGGVIISRVTGPVQSLTRAAESIGAGALDVSVNSPAMHGELRVLAETIEHMAARLRESYAELERQVAERNEALRTINAIADLVSRSPELDRVVAASLDGVLEALQIQTGVVFVREPYDADRERGVMDAGKERLGIVEQRGVPEALLTLMRDAPLARLAVASLQPVVINDARHDPAAPELLRRTEFRSLASIPLVAQGRAVGAMTVACQAPGRFPPEAVELLRTIGNQIGVAIESARLFGQARQLATLEERQRLARDLHDAVSQSLYGVSLYAEAASRMLDAGRGGEAGELLDRLRDTSADAIREMRLLIFELRPPILEQSGLEGALRTRLEAVEARSGLTAHLEASDIERLPAEIEEALYRIAQEALNNALKHAGASRVELRLIQADGQLRLELLDDGRGFDPAEVDTGGMGLTSMRQRAARIGASFEIAARVEGGTRVTVALALEPERDPAPASVRAGLP